MDLIIFLNFLRGLFNFLRVVNLFDTFDEEFRTLASGILLGFVCVCRFLGGGACLFHATVPVLRRSYAIFVQRTVIHGEKLRQRRDKEYLVRECNLEEFDRHFKGDEPRAGAVVQLLACFESPRSKLERDLGFFVPLPQLFSGPLEEVAFDCQSKQHTSNHGQNHHRHSWEMLPYVFHLGIVVAAREGDFPFFVDVDVVVQHHVLRMQPPLLIVVLVGLVVGSLEIDCRSRSIPVPAFEAIMGVSDQLALQSHLSTPFGGTARSKSFPEPVVDLRKLILVGNRTLVPDTVVRTDGAVVGHWVAVLGHKVNQDLLHRWEQRDAANQDQECWREREVHRPRHVRVNPTRNRVCTNDVHRQQNVLGRFAANTVRVTNLPELDCGGFQKFNATLVQVGMVVDGACGRLVRVRSLIVDAAAAAAVGRLPRSLLSISTGILTGILTTDVNILANTIFSTSIGMAQCCSCGGIARLLRLAVRCFIAAHVLPGCSITERPVGPPQLPRPPVPTAVIPVRGVRAKQRQLIDVFTANQPNLPLFCVKQHADPVAFIVHATTTTTTTTTTRVQVVHRRVWVAKRNQHRIVSLHQALVKLGRTKPSVPAIHVGLRRVWENVLYQTIAIPLLPPEIVRLVRAPFAAASAHIFVQRLSKLVHSQTAVAIQVVEVDNVVFSRTHPASHRSPATARRRRFAIVGIVRGTSRNHSVTVTNETNKVVGRTRPQRQINRVVEPGRDAVLETVQLHI